MTPFPNVSYGARCRQAIAKMQHENTVHTNERRHQYTWVI